MKNLVTKIITITQVCLSAIFVIMLLLTISGVLPLNIIDGKLIFDSYLVVLLMIIGVFYAICSIYMIYEITVRARKIKYIKLNTNFETMSEVDSNIIKSIAKKTAKSLKNVKCLKVSIFTNESNYYTLNVTIKAKTNDTHECTEKYRFAMIDAFEKILGFKFTTIKFTIKKLKSDYTPDQNKINNNYTNEQVVDNKQENVENKTEEIATVTETENIENDIVENTNDENTEVNEEAINENINNEVTTEEATVTDNNENQNDDMITTLDLDNIFKDISLDDGDEIIDESELSTENNENN